MQRALMTFGNAIGLALHDKQQREITDGAGSCGGHRTLSHPQQCKSRLPSRQQKIPAWHPSIADRICQRRHHAWIEPFLVSHR